MENKRTRLQTHTDALLWNMLAGVLIIVVSTLWLPTGSSGGIFTTQSANASVLGTATLQQPLNVVAVAFDATSIDLVWDPTASAYATGYIVYRATSSGGPFAAVAPVARGNRH